MTGDGTTMEEAGELSTSRYQPPGAPGRHRRPGSGLGSALGSVRGRATLAAVVVVGAAMAVGAVALLGLLRTSMTNGLETTARTQLTDVGSLLRLGQLPALLPASPGDTFTQVVGPDGNVLATSATLLGTRPISNLQPTGGGTMVRTVPTLFEQESGDSNDPEGPYVLVARAYVTSLETKGRIPVTVYVAASLRPVAQAATTVGLALAGGLPVLVLLVGALVWILSGRALRPVESIRAEVADISGHDLHRRVPEPRSRDEVARLAGTMNAMLDRLESSAGAQRQFVADASHELRSPLAVLKATLEVALAHPDDTSWHTVADDALQETGRLQRLVDDLLVLARMEHVEPDERAEPVEVDLDEIVLREARQHRAAAHPVSLDLHRVSAGRVLGHPDGLTRVVHNLMDNARRHANTQVCVELFAAAGTVVLAVSDDGPGIRAADRERVFERFARLDEARSLHEGGTGLGLAITKEIVVDHGGTIEIEGDGIGTRFVVRLPRPWDGDEVHPTRPPDDARASGPASRSIVAPRGTH